MKVWDIRYKSLTSIKWQFKSTFRVSGHLTHDMLRLVTLTKWEHTQIG